MKYLKVLLCILTAIINSFLCCYFSYNLIVNSVIVGSDYSIEFKNRQIYMLLFFAVFLAKSAVTAFIDFIIYKLLSKSVVTSKSFLLCSVIPILITVILMTFLLMIAICNDVKK